MVPDISVIDAYIRHERRDYQARVAAAELGQIVPRTLPSIRPVHRVLLLVLLAVFLLVFLKRTGKRTQKDARL